MTNLRQVFVGCPFEEPIREYYDKLKRDVGVQTPLDIVLADTAVLYSARPLLEHITDLIKESAACIFDVTGANPNVALEIGIAHAVPVRFAITLNPEEQKKSSQDPERMIIADLQGRRRIDYTDYATLKRRIYDNFFPSLPFYQRWRTFKRRRSFVTGALAVFRELRQSEPLKRAEIIRILEELKKDSKEGLKFDPRELLGYLKETKLITERRVRNGGFFFPSR